MYGQTEVVKDLIAARLESGRPLHFEVSDVSLHDLDGDRPRIRYAHEGAEHELECDVVAGCDGFHGVSRQSIPAGRPAGVHRATTRTAGSGSSPPVAPSHDELIYARDRARASRSSACARPSSSRLYLQCAPDEDLDAWPDERIWAELQARLGVGRLDAPRGADPREGRHADAQLRRRADAVGAAVPCGRRRAHRPADRREGAQPRDSRRPRARGRARRVVPGRRAARCSTLYSETCLRRVWRAEHFSWWMTTMLHRHPDDDAFGLRLQQSQLRQLTDVAGGGDSAGRELRRPRARLSVRDPT